MRCRLLGDRLQRRRCEQWNAFARGSTRPSGRMWDVGVWWRKDVLRTSQTAKGHAASVVNVLVTVNLVRTVLL